MAFIGCLEGLEGYKANWNFIQSSTSIYVKYVFGILRERWWIIMKMVDVPLQYIVDIVATSIVL